jgi:hypothetical protein
MQPTYKEEWIVKVGKEAFTLDEKQILILNEAMKRGERWVKYPKFILSVPHIECIYLSHREIANQLQAPEKVEKEYTPEERAKTREKIAAIRSELSSKLHFKTK